MRIVKGRKFQKESRSKEFFGQGGVFRVPGEMATYGCRRRVYNCIRKVMAWQKAIVSC